MDKIVVHGKDGSLLKGHSADFSHHLPWFHLATLQDPSDSVKIILDDQKAVFFVRHFSGDATREDLEAWHRGSFAGKHVTVTFTDGERIHGTVGELDRKHAGFFLEPVDPGTNNIRVFVINSAVESVRPG